MSGNNTTNPSGLFAWHISTNLSTISTGIKGLGSSLNHAFNKFANTFTSPRLITSILLLTSDNISLVISNYSENPFGPENIPLNHLGDDKMKNIWDIGNLGHVCFWLQIISYSNVRNHYCTSIDVPWNSLHLSMIVTRLKPEQNERRNVNLFNLSITIFALTRNISQHP
jgi:hypothetical protein